MRSATRVEYDVVDEEGRSSTYVDDGPAVPHRLGYAGTTNSAQGAQYAQVVVVVDAHRFRGVNRRLLYTAVSRAQRTALVVASASALLRACAPPPRPAPQLGLE